jgi:membrane-associated PAP2 superfamily phosphatase
LACGLAAGWIVGVYQILKGAHYVSHTIVTMLLAWLIVQLLARAFGLGGSAPRERAA